MAFNESFTVVSNTIYAFLTKQFGWLYLVAMLFFVLFVLLMAGGLKLLQITSIAAAFPFIFIMLATCVSLVKVLKEERA